MILRLAHLSINVDRYDVVLGQLQQVGYRMRQRYIDVPNPGIKKAFLSDYQPMHSLSIAHRSDSPDIELVEQGANIALPPYIFGITTSPQQVTLVLHEHSFSAQTYFWEMLGFRRDEMGYRASYPMGKAPVFVQSKRGSPVEDIPCCSFYAVAFLSHNAASDWKRLRAQGLHTSELDSLVLGENILNIFFVFGPNHEIVEFMILNQTTAAPDICIR